MNGVNSTDGQCRIFWTSTQVDAAQVTFNDLLTPLVLALALGRLDDSTMLGEVRDFRLAGVCTDVRVGFAV